jgi:hypothetical protein
MWLGKKNWLLASDDMAVENLIAPECVSKSGNFEL